MKTKELIRRHLPCNQYDVEGIESWLTDMAQHGYILKSKPMRFGGLYFEKKEPQNISYRLEASPEGEGTWGDAGEPEEDAKELNEKYGWEFVVKCGAFYIYRSLKPHTRELNTDPEVQAYSLNILIKKKLKEIIPISIWIIFLASELVQKGLIVVTQAAFISWIIYILVAFSSLITIFSEIIRIKKLQKTLNINGTLNHEKKIKNRAFIYVAGRCLTVVLLISALMSIFMFWPPQIQTKGYSEELPFATIEDLLYNETPEHKVSAKKVTSTDFGQWRSVFSPKNIYWQEQIEFTDENGKNILCLITVDYHEMINESLAQQIAEDYYRYDHRKDDAQDIELSSVKAEYSAAYAVPVKAARIVIQKENKVLHATLLRVSGNEDTYAYLDSWVNTLADSIE